MLLALLSSEPIHAAPTAAAAAADCDAAVLISESLLHLTVLHLVKGGSGIVLQDGMEAEACG